MSCFALCLYLGAEASLPAASQPTARISVALIHGYQATGSRAMEACGIRCRYRPSCSHYAEDAISHYGTLNGLVRAAGRLLRCAPWGGGGYDPAVETHSAAYFAPEAPEAQETPEERKARLDAEREAREAAEKFKRDMEKIKQEFPKEAGEAAAACGVGCVLVILTTLVGLAVEIFMMVFAYKDAKARGDQNAVLWIVLIFFLHVIGFVVYMIARPKGELAPCPNCHQKKLEILTKCPHCGNDTGAIAKPAGP